MDCARQGAMRQSGHWINAVPMEAGLASAEHAAAALERLESPLFSGALGIYHTGGPRRGAERKIWAVNNGVMAVGEARYGRTGSGQALRYMRAVASAIDVEMPGASPEMLSSPAYDVWGDMHDRLMVMQAWSSYAIHWPVVHFFLGIDPDVPARRVRIVPQVPGSWPGLSITGLRIGTTTLDASAGASRSRTRYATRALVRAPFEIELGHVLPRGARVRGVTLDGAPIAHEVRDTTRGREVVVRTRGGHERELVVSADPGR